MVVFLVMNDGGGVRAWGVTPQEIKKAIQDAGLEIYRTTSHEVIVADRVRDNLILDSGVRVRVGDPLEVRLVMGVRRGQYPNETDDQLFARLRELSSPALTHGFEEISHNVSAVADPADTHRTLDTFFEIILSRKSAEDGVLDDVRFALNIAKTAESRH